MKIRTGFVSNSSSSSFAVYGLNLRDDDSISAIMKKYDIKDKSDLYEFADMGISKELTSFWEYESENLVLGLSWEQMREDETLSEFKKRAYSLIAECLPFDLDKNACSMLIDVAYT